MADEISSIYGQINQLDSRVTKLESTRPFLEEMIEREIATSEKLSETLQDVQVSMTKMNSKMDEQSKAIEDMKIDFAEANKKTNERIEQVNQRQADNFGKIEKRMGEVEEKGKFDIQLFIKQNWPWIIVVLGLGMGYVADFIKF